MLNGLAPSGLSMPDERSDEVGRARRTRVLIGAIVVVAATLVVIVGWYAHSGSLTRLGFDWQPIRIVLRETTLVGWSGSLIGPDQYLGSLELGTYTAYYLPPDRRVPRGDVAITLSIRDVSR